MGIFTKKKKLKRLLIANRGEIAVRIIKASKNLGIKTYVLKSPKEPNAMYLAYADHIIDVSEIEDATTIFLDAEKLVKIARNNKIDAIHPGYGFLSESPYFAKLCEENKINFVGPSSELIHQMGNKTIAREIARKHKIPMVEGSRGSVKSYGEALAVAEKVGYPVIIKAAAGGGGRGMRIVNHESEMKKNFNLATNEAQTAFNNPAVFVEKYVSKPKHIEFQIVGDKHGNVIHLGERECSIQRKHQKLLEEAPSSALDEDLRHRMGEVSVRLAKAIGYYSLGTVEFLLDDNNQFYFMEMNTRIQVEHPVTEFVTGIDLAELQISIAEGEELPYKQEDVTLKGWAIECRINAEDVQAGFAPSLGYIEKVVFPSGKKVRVDTGVQSGTEITPYFDSMVAKLIGYGDDRPKTITNTLNAIKRLKIKGVKTTMPFCKAVLTNNAFRQGTYDTSFVEHQLSQNFYQEPGEEMLAAYIATYDFLDRIKQDEEHAPDFNKGKEISPWVLNKRLKSL